MAMTEQTKPDPSPVAPPSGNAWSGRSMLAGVASRDILMTPQSVMQKLRDADAGDIYQQAILYEEMEERDAAIGAHLQTRKLGLLACGWELLPADDSAEAQRALDLCQAALDGLSVMASPRADGLDAAPSLEDVLFDILDAIGKGFSVTEIHWDTSTGQWWPKALEHRPQRWFRLDPTGTELQLAANTYDLSGVRMNPLNFILHTHRARSGSLPRCGLLRGIARPFVIRNYGWKDWLAFAEIFGMPPRIGILPEGATPQQQDELFRAVKALASDYCAVISSGTKIEFPEISSKSSTTIFERLIELAGRDITWAILGQLLTSGGEQGGSYALGKVQQQVRFDLIDSDARRLAYTLRRQLLAPICRFNLGPDAPVPQWHWKVEEPGDLPQLATTIETLGRSGLKIPATWVYEKFGIPQPDAGEPVLTPAAAAPAPYSPPQFNRSHPTDLSDSSRRRPEPEPDPTYRSNARRPAPHKQASARAEDLLGGFSAVENAATTWADDLREAITQFVHAQGGLKPALNALPALRKALPDFGDMLADPQLVALLAGMADVGAEATTAANARQLRQGANGGRGAWADPYVAPVRAQRKANGLPSDPSYPTYRSNAITPRDIQSAFNLPPKDAIAWFKQKQVVSPEIFKSLDAASKARSFAVSGMSNDYAVDTVRKSLEGALESGTTANEWLSQLETTLGDAGLSAAGDLPLAHLRQVFETNVMSAYSAGRFAQMERTKTARPYRQWLTTGRAYDPTTGTGVCPTCAALDGIVKRADDPFWSSYFPPLHHGPCQCVVTTLDDEELAELGLKGPTSDDEIGRRYGGMSGGENQMPPVKAGFGGNPAERFFVGIAPTPEGQAALDLLTGAM